MGGDKSFADDLIARLFLKQHMCGRDYSGSYMRDGSNTRRCLRTMRNGQKE
jgi:hypothetical protein